MPNELPDCLKTLSVCILNSNLEFLFDAKHHFDTVETHASLLLIKLIIQQLHIQHASEFLADATHRADVLEPE